MRQYMHSSRTNERLLKPAWQMASMLSLLLCVFFLNSCCCNPFGWGYRPVQVVDPAEMTWIVQQQMAKYRHQEKRRLRLEHSSFDYSKPTATLHLEISSQEILDVEESRNLLVDFVEDLIKSVNTNPIMSSQLASVPFSPDQLFIEINFESYLGKYVDDLYIGCIRLQHGIAHYYAFDMKSEYLYSWHSRVEPYSKTREVSLLQRSAEREYAAQHSCHESSFAEELHIPECRDLQWRF